MVTLKGIPNIYYYECKKCRKQWRSDKLVDEKCPDCGSLDYRRIREHQYQPIDMVWEKKNEEDN